MSLLRRAFVFSALALCCSVSAVQAAGVPGGASDDQAPAPGAVVLRVLPPPSSALWRLPVAAQHEPRMEGKLTTLAKRSAETAIGGVFPVARVESADRPRNGLELDIAAGVFTRFDHRYALTVADYMVAIPVTWVQGGTALRAGFSHTSSHLGDDYLDGSDRAVTTVKRDELTVDAAQTLSPRLRIVARIATMFHAKGLPPGRERMGLGIEWRPLAAGLFAAIDVERRAWQDWESGTTVRAGWQWQAESGRVFRVALEGYKGRSPFDQFAASREKWVGFMFDLD